MSPYQETTKAPTLSSMAAAGVHRVSAHGVCQFGNVVETIPVNVRRVGDEVSFHPVALCGEVPPTLSSSWVVPA